MNIIEESQLNEETIPWQGPDMSGLPKGYIPLLCPPQDVLDVGRWLAALPLHQFETVVADTIRRSINDGSFSACINRTKKHPMNRKQKGLVGRAFVQYTEDDPVFKAFLPYIDFDSVRMTHLSSAVQLEIYNANEEHVDSLLFLRFFLEEFIQQPTATQA